MAQNALPRGNACLTCRKKKQKCDGTKPTCHPCFKANKDCVYNERIKSRAEVLQERISDLESRGGHTEGSSASSGSASDSPRSNGSLLTFGFGSGRPPFASRGGSPASSLVVTPAGSLRNLVSSSVNRPFGPDIDPGLRDTLLQTFLQNRDKCCIDLHSGRFYHSVNLPPASPAASHPALLQSALLVGCYFSRSSSLADFEVRLLAQARQELSASAQQADRLLDFVRASNLVAFYYYSKGMYGLAHEQLYHSARMSVACGLHQILSSQWSPEPAPEEFDTLLSHPLDNVELGERIYTFWQVVCLDRLVSMVIRQPPHILDGPHVDPSFRVTTPWPRLLSDYESGTVLDDFAADAFVPRLLQSHKLETLSGLRAQGLCLAHHALQLNSTAASQQEVTYLDNSINAFLSHLPPLRAICEPRDLSVSNSEILNRLAFIHTLPHLAQLILYQHGSDAGARHRVGMATQGIVGIIHHLPPEDYADLFSGIGHAWYLSCNILVHIYHASQGAIKDQVGRDLMTMVQALANLSATYPVLSFQVQELEKMMARPA